MSIAPEPRMSPCLRCGYYFCECPTVEPFGLTALSMHGTDDAGVDHPRPSSGPTPLEAIRDHGADMFRTPGLEGRGAVLLGLVSLQARETARWRAASRLASAACAYVDAAQEDDDLNDGTLYGELESARDEYARLLRRIDEEAGVASSARRVD
jgi:hypothetical protein